MLTTDRLRIIPLEERHLEQLRQMRNNFQTWHYLTDTYPISQDAQTRWFEKLKTDKSHLYLAIERKEGQVVTSVEGGHVGVQYGYELIGILRSDCWDRTNRSVQIGIDMGTDFRGQGYATEAFSAFIDYLFKQQNMHRIWFFVADGNEAGKKLYNKLGFKEEGRQRQALFRDGQYQDYVMMSLLEDEWQK